MKCNLRTWQSCAAASALLATCGCSQPPAIDILGSLFPAWLECIVMGAVLVAVSHWLLQRYSIRLVYPPLTYLCIGAVFTFAIWLIFY